MLPVYPDPISEFEIANFDFINVLFLTYWTNDYANVVSTVTCHFGFEKELFINVFTCIRNFQ